MLSEIADGIELTEKQRDHGVATVDETGATLADGLAAFEDDLPCPPETAATIAESYIGGRSVGDVARDTGVPPITASKTLHLLGIEGLSPLAPEARRIVRDWQRGKLSRSEAQLLVGASETEFTLAAYIESHEPLSGITAVVEAALQNQADAAVEKRETLAETMSGVTDLA